MTAANIEVVESKKWFLDADITDLKAPIGYDISLPTLVGSVTDMKVGNVLALVLNGHIRPYPNNRGAGATASKTSKAVAAKPDADGIGTFGFGMYEGLPTLGDGHSRIAGLLKRLKAGLLTLQDLEIPTAMKFAEDFITYYRITNAGSPHSMKNKMGNRDLAYGAVIERVLDAAGPDIRNLIGHNRNSVLSAIIWNMHLKPAEQDNWFWPRVYFKRNVATKVANEKATDKDFNIAEAKLVAAIKFWYELYKNIPDGDCKRAAKTAGFFGYVIADRLSPTPGISSNHALNAKKLVKCAAKFSRLAVMLTRANYDFMVDDTETMSEILKDGRVSRHRKAS